MVDGSAHTHQTGQGEGRPVGLAHEESPKDDLVEGSISTAGQESVQLDHTHTLIVRTTAIILRSVKSGHSRASLKVVQVTATSIHTHSQL